MSTISELKATIRDYARPNKFRVDIYMNSGTPEATELLTLGHNLITTFHYPSITTGEVYFSRMGKKFKLPGDTTYGDFTLGFYVDKDYRIFNLITKWLGAVVDFSKKHVYASPAQFFGATIDIFALDTQLNPVNHLRLHNAFPMSVSELTFAHSSENQLLETNVYFGFTHLEFLEISKEK